MAPPGFQFLSYNLHYTHYKFAKIDSLFLTFDTSLSRLSTLAPDFLSSIAPSDPWSLTLSGPLPDFSKKDGLFPATIWCVPGRIFGVPIINMLLSERGLSTLTLDPPNGFIASKFPRGVDGFMPPNDDGLWRVDPGVPIIEFSSFSCSVFFLKMKSNLLEKNFILIGRRHTKECVVILIQASIGILVEY